MNSCNGKQIPWRNKPISKDPTQPDAKRASAFMRNAVNEFGCYDAKTEKVVANTKAGMKGQGWLGAPSVLTSLCPYGMTYNDSLNTNLNDVIGNNCVDAQPDGCKNYIMGQCLDTPPTPATFTFDNVYLTWFWWPNLAEAALKTYINFQIATCHAMGDNSTSKLPVNGLCFPLVAWPDKNNNMTFLHDKFKTDMEYNRGIVGKWMVTNLFNNTTLVSNGHTVYPGYLLYISFKDGPWAGGFFSDWQTSKGSGSIHNPLTGSPFPPYSDYLPGKKAGTGSIWVWGAFIYFFITYVVPNCAGGQLPEKFWLHLDKEGSQAEDTLFNQYDYTQAVNEHLGRHIKKHAQNVQDNPIIFLASSLTAPCTPVTPNPKTDACDYTVCPPVIVPEYYWGAGNQLPCDGSEGSYGYSRLSCTSLSTHRRLAGHSNAYLDLIDGNGVAQGSDCKSGKDTNGWLGDGGWHVASTNNFTNVWPSFSIENLSMCDLDDPNCYSQMEKQKKENKGLNYTDFTDKTTVCTSMLFGSLMNGGENQPLKQGMKSCGVFDGFSHWKWPDFVDFLKHLVSATRPLVTVLKI